MSTHILPSNAGYPTLFEPSEAHKKWWARFVRVMQAMPSDMEVVVAARRDSICAAPAGGVSARDPLDEDITLSLPAFRPHNLVVLTDP